MRQPCRPFMEPRSITGIILIVAMVAAPAIAIEQQPEAVPKPAAEQQPADPRDGRCDLCGGCACVRKVCVPKPTEREVKKTCWSYKCEDFCVPGPSEYCGRKCGQDECGWWSFDVWKPTWAEMRTKKVPVKTEVTRKVPAVEWTPEERCAACRGPGFFGGKTH